MFQAVHDSDPDPKLLAYQYLQTLPQLAQSPGNTMWVIPSEVTSALRTISRAFGEDEQPGPAGPRPSGSRRATAASRARTPMEQLERCGSTAGSGRCG